MMPSLNNFCSISLSANWLFAAPKTHFTFLILLKSKNSWFKSPPVAQGEKISIWGFVELMNCDKCKLKSQRLILQADTDMVYRGVVGLTDLKRKRIVITHLNQEEWNNFKEFVPDKLEERINEIFNVSSFRYFQYNRGKGDEFNGSQFKISCPVCMGNWWK